MDQGPAAARCAHCGATLAADAPWCSLCLTPVAPPAPVVAARPAGAAPVVGRAPAAPPVHVADGHPRPASGTAGGAPRGRHARPADPGTAADAAGTDAAATADDGLGLRAVAIGIPAPRIVGQVAAVESPPPAVAAVPEEDAPAWPCHRCGASVPIELDVCPHCGGGFLGGARAQVPSLVLPVVGDLGQKSQNQRYVIAGILGLLLAGVLVAVVAVLGAVL